MIHIYTRVSTDKQEVLAQEHDLLKRFPTGEVHKEIASGAKHRPKLDELVAKLKSGDTLVVSALDRLGRKTSEILLLIEGLYLRGVNVVSVRENLDYGTPSGRLVCQIMVSVSELERSLISQRTKAALQAKKAAGVRLGPPEKFSEETLNLARQMRAEGKMYSEIKAATGMSMGKLSQILSAA